MKDETFLNRRSFQRSTATKGAFIVWKRLQNTSRQLILIFFQFFIFTRLGNQACWHTVRCCGNNIDDFSPLSYILTGIRYSDTLYNTFVRMANIKSFSLLNLLNSHSIVQELCKIYEAKYKEGREGGGVTIPFPTRDFSKIPVPVGFLLKIPVEVIKIPVNKK